MTIVLHDKLTEEEREQVNEVARRLHREAIETPESGINVEYQGREYFVAQGIFHPRYDSRPLVNNMIINRGERVLDMCTGSGVIAVNAAIKGAIYVLAVDVNPNSVKSVETNAERYVGDNSYGFRTVVEARCSNLFDLVSPDEKFDVVTINPPFHKMDYTRIEERSTCDPDYIVHKGFFSRVGKHLREGGRIYMAQANFGDVDLALDLADKASFHAELIGRRPLRPTIDSPEIFYAFELRRKE